MVIRLMPRVMFAKGHRGMCLTALAAAVGGVLQ